MGDKAIRTLEQIRPIGVALEDQFDVVAINLHVGDCLRLVYREGAVDRGGVDSEGRHGFVKRIRVGGGGVPPLLAILPHHTALLRFCAHMARRLVDALENTRSVWVMVPSL